VVERALSMEDPWAIHGIGDLEEEECTRYRYSSIRKKWVTDTVRIKMESESFARGAMRLCYRLKKLSNFHRGSDWSHALNYVAKRYIDPETTRETYFEDVRLQMDAKLWAEEYNRHNPPKKVDIFQITILEFKERADSPLFHLEHFIEGEYMKYNSNSGFVSEVCRQTPHAFSHFTFERSGHQLIVVDVQGVGDLYTDPQIHTKEGKGYGDGNLGTKGMALFFFTHECNEICRKMDLTPFNLSPTEKATRKKHFKPRVDSATVCKGKTIHTCMSPGKEETSDIMEFLRHRTLSASSSEYSNSVTSLPDAIEEEGGHMVNEGSRGDSPPGCRRVDAPRLTSEGSNEVFELPLAQRRNRLDSDMDSIASSTGSTHISEKEAYWEAMRKMSRPAGLNNMGVDSDFPQFVARKQSDDSDGSVLGQVHLDMCRYHELGRFSDEGTEPGVYDKAAAWFHLEIAANCGVLEAILTCARIFLGLPHDLLEEFTVEPDENSEDRGLDWMEMAANRRDRGAMLFLADAYEKGTPLGSERTKSYEKAVHYLEKAMACDEGEEEEQSEASLCVVDTPRYAIHSTMAQLFRTGGFGLEKNPMKAGDLYNEAAEEAMEQAKGKLANKFYMLAEEAWAEVEEEE
jgi:elongation factor 2 kinase